MAGLTVPSANITVRASGDYRAVPCIVKTGATIFWGTWVTEVDGKITEAGDESANVYGIVDYDPYLIQDDPTMTKYAVGQTVKVLKGGQVYTKAGTEVAAAPIKTGDYVVLSSATTVQKFVAADHDITMIVGKADTAADTAGDILIINKEGWN